MGVKRLFALRGAVQCLNSRDDIQDKTILLYDELLVKNKLAEEDIVSLTFSLTSDLDAANPATALRNRGRAGEAALFAVQEAQIKGSLDHVIRVLIHCYLEETSVPVHAYLNGAEVLRPDRKLG